MDPLMESQECRTNLFALPAEVLDLVAFELAATQPLGPPHSVLPLLSTCSTLNDRLSSLHNPHLWARIFCYRFDCSSVKRRAFQPSDSQYLEQLQSYCVGMQRLRAGNIFFGSLVTDFSEDVGLDEALMTGIIMMLENDGKNERQLLEWAAADRLVSCFVRRRLYEGREENNGWPLESVTNSCALTLMWLLTSEETLRQESLHERKQIMSAIFPFISVPFRYATAEAPPNFFSLPFPSRASTPPTSFQTAHGTYPIFPTRNRASIEPHYGSRPSVSVPLASVAAKLLYFARAELTRLQTPSHMAANRAAWLARDGNAGVGLTAEDIDEFNWGWKARPPLLSGRFRPVVSQGIDCSGWSWGIGDTNTFGSFVENIATNALANQTPSPRWSGKAPHSTPSRLWPRSQRWDADWWRLRLCNDPFMARTRIPYGPVFEMGSLDGLWQGYYMVPDEGRLRLVLAEPQMPTAPLDDALRTTIQPFYMRLREAHSLRSQPVTELGTNDYHRSNMNNAWYDGLPGTTEFVVDGRDSNGTGRVDILAGGRKQTCVLWSKGIDEIDHGLGLGNDAFRDEASVGGDSDLGVGHGGGSWTGYPHDTSHCEECVARSEMKQQIQRDRAFASVGLGVATNLGTSSTVQEDVGDDEAGQLDELEPGEPAWVDEDGNVYPPISPSIDRTKLASSRCSGVREVYCFGETDTRHGDAWGHYRFYGRVRSWDGLVAILRCPIDGGQDTGMILLYGYICGGNTFTGNWRSIGVHEGAPGWEGPFVMSRRED